MSTVAPETPIKTSGQKRVYGETVLATVDRQSSMDSYLLHELDIAMVSYKPTFTKGKSGGGELCYSSYKTARIFLEMGPVTLGFKGIGQYVETDEDAKAKQKNEHNDWSITLFCEANPDIVPFFTQLDEHNVQYCALRSEDKTFFNKKKDADTIRENLYNPIIKVNHSTKGTIPPQIKFKVPVNQKTGLPVCEIWSHNNALLYRHYDNERDNDADAALRAEKNYGDWEHPTELLKGGEQVIVVVQYTGLYKTQGKIGGTFKVLRFQKMQAERPVAQAFRTRILPSKPVENAQDDSTSQQSSPSKADNGDSTNTEQTASSEAEGSPTKKQRTEEVETTSTESDAAVQSADAATSA